MSSNKPSDSSDLFSRDIGFCRKIASTRAIFRSSNSFSFSKDFVALHFQSLNLCEQTRVCPAHFSTSASSSRRRDIFDHVPNILPAYQIAPPWRPQSPLGKKPELCDSLFKMSVEGTRREAYFASKEGVHYSTLISSSSKKSLSISGEKLGRSVGWRKRANRRR